MKHERIVEAVEKVVSLLKKAEEIITNLLAPQLTSKNMLRISSTFATIASVAFLEHVFTDDELEKDVEKVRPPSFAPLVTWNYLFKYFITIDTDCSVACGCDGILHAVPLPQGLIAVHLVIHFLLSQ